MIAGWHGLARREGLLDMTRKASLNPIKLVGERVARLGISDRHPPIPPKAGQTSCMSVARQVVRFS